jgi:hypothetical protein
MDVARSNLPALVADFAPSDTARAPFTDLLLNWVDKHRRAFFIFVGLIYIAGFNGQWRAEPDSALYLCVARALVSGQGYTYHNIPHQLAYPGLPLIVAGTFEIFHTRSIWPAQVLLVMFGAAALALTYRMMSLFAGRKTAVLITVGLALTRLFFRYCFEMMTDMPFLTGVLAFLAGYEAVCIAPMRGRGASDSPSEAASYNEPIEQAVRPRRSGRWYDWALMISGLALTLVMRPAVLSFLPVVIGVSGVSFIRRWSRHRRAAAVVGAVALIAVVGAAIFYSLDPRRAGQNVLGEYEQEILQRTFHQTGEVMRIALFENIPELFHESLAQSMFGQQLGPLGPIVAIVVFSVAIGLARRRPMWGLWVASTVLMMIIVLPHDRYLLAVLPLLVYSWWLIIVWVNRKLPGTWGNLAAAFMIYFGLVYNGLQIGRTIIEQRHIPFLAYYQDGQCQALADMGARIHTIVPKDAFVLAPKKTARILSWYSNRLVVESNDLPAIDPKQQDVYVMVDPEDQESKLWERQIVDQLHLAWGANQTAPITTIARARPHSPLKLWKAQPE